MGQQLMFTHLSSRKMASAPNTNILQKIANGEIVEYGMQSSVMNGHQKCMVTWLICAMAEKLTQGGQIAAPRKEDLSVAPLDRHTQLSENRTDMFGRTLIGLGIAQATKTGQHVFQLDPRGLLGTVPHDRMAVLQVQHQVCGPWESGITLGTMNSQLQFRHRMLNDVPKIPCFQNLLNGI